MRLKFRLGLSDEVCRADVRFKGCSAEEFRLLKGHVLELLGLRLGGLGLTPTPCAEGKTNGAGSALPPPGRGAKGPMAIGGAGGISLANVRWARGY